MVSTPTVDELYASAAKFAQSALDAHHKDDHQRVAIDVGTSLEHLTKACLANRSPAFLVELKPGNWESLAQLCGHSQPQLKQLRTVATMPWAAAGRHHMLFHGPPRVGKTMLAERVPGLLPDLVLHDALEVSAVHSLAGFNLADEVITRPPYSDPHHSASVASIVGGGQRMARPGAISCAHKGVLFLDDSTGAQSIRLIRVSFESFPRSRSVDRAEGQELPLGASPDGA
jgi:Magnesium chelatase, subunit ChlI